MKLNQYQAQRLLNQYLEMYGQITIDGHIEDLYWNRENSPETYWESEELEAVQRLFELYGEMSPDPLTSESHSTQLKFKKLSPFATAPQRAKDLDAGYDITSAETVTLMPGERYLCSTGIAIETPEGTYASVNPRSGLAHTQGITVLNAPGTVDEGYRGEVKVNLINHDTQAHKIRQGARIAQLIIKRYETPDVVEVQELSETARGSAGHGSTDAVVPGYFPKGL